MRYAVFIQANDKQRLGAVVARHAIRRHCAHNEKLDVRIMHYDEFPFLRAREGELYLRDGERRVWRSDDLQSFTPTRFLPPELMGYEGRALVIDPDVFALADVWELLTRDMQGKAILCRSKGGRKGREGRMASSVMLLDAARLRHWQVERDFNEMFELRRDYMTWVSLQYEPAGTIGPLEPEWNDFDRLTPATCMLHCTKRKTQPWKTGLPVDFRPADSFRLFPPRHWLRRARRAAFGDYGLLGRYKPHPDPAQERLFFGLLRECVESGEIEEATLRREMAANHLRHDALELLEHTPALEPPQHAAA